MNEPARPQWQRVVPKRGRCPRRAHCRLPLLFPLAFQCGNMLEPESLFSHQAMHLFLWSHPIMNPKRVAIDEHIINNQLFRGMREAARSWRPLFLPVLPYPYSKRDGNKQKQHTPADPIELLHTISYHRGFYIFGDRNPPGDQHHTKSSE